MEGLRITTELLEQGRSAVIVEGEVDLATAPEFELALLGAIAGNRATVIVDLSLCSLIDSTALRVLVKVNKSGNGHRDTARLVLVAPDGIVLKVLTVAKFDQVFEIYPSRADAINGTTGNHHRPLTRSE